MRADRLTLAILLLWLVAILAAVARDAQAEPHGMMSINQLAEAEGWARDLQPRQVVMFRTGSPSVPCRDASVHGCEQHMPHASIITTPRSYCEMPAALVLHELAHSCGWRHD